MPVVAPNKESRVVSHVSRPRILIVEDEPAQMELLAYNLRNEGYDVLTADDGEEAMLTIQEEMPDLIVLDWMIPSVTGIELCRRVKKRKTTKSIPIVLLTARGEEEDKIRGLDTGAEDYIVKPYSVQELLARIRVVLRRNLLEMSDGKIHAGDISVDMGAHRVWVGKAEAKVGPIEYKLLVTLMQTPEQVLSRDQLLDKVWGRHSDVETRTVDVHIGRLRKILHKAGKVDPIRTVRGFGYSLSAHR